MEYQRGKYYCTVDLLFDWFGSSCMTTDNFCFYLQNRLIQTSQTGGQWYSNTTPLVFPDLTNAYRSKRLPGNQWVEPPSGRIRQPPVRERRVVRLRLRD
jgi:hypothetical protein